MKNEQDNFEILRKLDKNPKVSQRELAGKDLNKSQKEGFFD